MKISQIKLSGYRNFNNATINLHQCSLIIGANDIGKSNLLHGIRLILDRSLPETVLIPLDSDFHVNREEQKSDTIELLITLCEVNEDAIRSKLKGAISDDGECFIKYEASRASKEYRLYIGHHPDIMDEIDGRGYLRHIHLRYIQSTRDLDGFIKFEKKHLISISKEERDQSQISVDEELEAQIKEGLNSINRSIGTLNYVSKSTSALNSELKKLSIHHANYEIRLEAGALDFSRFIDQLDLGATTNGKPIQPGGDGRNNQILLALWKAKSEREFDLNSEGIIYCIEEPEAHLHPHQQREIVNYLIQELTGQVLVTTHSPQITSGFNPDDIVRLFEKDGASLAAQQGCSKRIEDAWREMGYRISILPAEAFFSDAVLLVEGPSEVQFYHALAKALRFDLDYYNISILSVDGISFGIYKSILNALELTCSVRTDNDVSKVPKKKEWQYAGLNRVRKLAGLEPYQNSALQPDPQTIESGWRETSALTAEKGLYLSRIDLENDLAAALSDELKSFAGCTELQDAINYLQSKKAIRMTEFLHSYASSLMKLRDDPFAMPLKYLVGKVQESRG